MQIDINSLADKIAWFATIVCFWITVIVANHLPSKTPRIYLTLVLFAMSWALLVPYYEPGVPKTDLLASLNGFVAVFVGVQLRREYQDRPILPPIVRWPVILLGIIVLPNSISVLTKGMFIDKEVVPRLEVAIGTLMTIFGFISLLEGIRTGYASNKKKLRGVRYFLGAWLFIYSGFEIWYSIWFWNNYIPPPEKPPNMPNFLLLSFAILKILLTISFLILIWHRPVAVHGVASHMSLFNWLIKQYNIFAYGVATPFEDQNITNSTYSLKGEETKDRINSDDQSKPTPDS
jgi:hypothetical protein